MGDALRKEFTGLDGRDDPVLQEAAGAISCRLLVGLLWSSLTPPVRPLKLSPPQVPGIPGQQQFVPGASTELIILPCIDYEVEDSRIGLD